MAWNPNVPTVTNRVQDDLNAIRENFQVLDAHLADTNNPHNVQAQQVPYSSGVAGFSPADVKAALDALAGVRIVEMGSNSNGQYVRWENGLQVCYVARPLISVPPGNFRRDNVPELAGFYPASFVSAPTTLLTILHGSSPLLGRAYLDSVGIAALGDANTAWAVGGYNYHTSSIFINIRLLAIGRWKS